MKVKLKKDAIEFRRELGYGITDSVNLYSLLIKLDIIAVFKPLSNNFSGMAISISKPEQNFILINSDHSIGRQNFSICHELYHLYKDEDFHPHHSYAGMFNIKAKNELILPQKTGQRVKPKNLNFSSHENKKKVRSRIQTDGC